MPGPIGKRDAERRRRNKPDVETISINLDEMVAKTVDVPKPPTKMVTHEHDYGCDDDCDLEEAEVSAWHPVAEGWYRSLMSSGQAIFYEPSDWMTAYLLAESLSRDLNPQVIGIVPESGEVKWATIPLKGGSLTAYLKGMSSLMTTEGERRRLKIELERRKATEAAASGVDPGPTIVKDRAELFAV